MIERTAIVAGLLSAALLCTGSFLARDPGSKYDPASLVEEAPDNFRAKFETSKGEFSVALALGMPVYGMFIALVVSGLIAEILDNGSQIYYYRKGV